MNEAQYYWSVKKVRKKISEMKVWKPQSSDPEVLI